MSTLLDRGTGVGRPTGGELRPSPFGTPALAAVRCAAASLVPVLVPVVAGWVLGAGGSASWIQAVRLAVGLWLLAHHAGLTIAGGHIGVIPLGLTALPLISCWYAGRRLARTMDPNAERIAAGATRATAAMASWQVLGTFCATYCVIVALASSVAAMPGMRPVTSQAVFGAAVVCATGGVLGAAAYRCAGPLAGLRWLLSRVPERVGPWLRPAAAAVGVQLGAGVALVGAMIGFGAPRVMALHHALETGRIGGVVLTVGELLLLPNLVLWACAAMAGPGFAVGAGTSVTLGSTTLGRLPAIPVLAALPAPGGAPRLAWALLAVPVLAGVTAGALVARRQPRSALKERLEHALGAALAGGAAMTLLSWLSGGPAGPGRMDAVGPSPLLAGAAITVEVGLGAGLSVLLASGVPWLTGRLAGGLHPISLRPASRPRWLPRWLPTRPPAAADTPSRVERPATDDPAEPSGDTGLAVWLRSVGGERSRG